MLQQLVIKGQAINAGIYIGVMWMPVDNKTRKDREVGFLCGPFADEEEASQFLRRHGNFEGDYGELHILGSYVNGRIFSGPPEISRQSTDWQKVIIPAEFKKELDQCIPVGTTCRAYRDGNGYTQQWIFATKKTSGAPSPYPKRA